MKENNLHIEYSEAAHLQQELAIQSGILKALIYFDIFNYPLTLQEIVQFSSVPMNNLSRVESSLHELTESFFIFKFGEFYSLKNDISWVERRKKGNINSINIHPKLVKRSHFIHRFPFIRSVNVSGSLSKNYFDDTTDFDFFVITAPNRIWIARMLLTIYKKIFLLNNRKYFCINYYIDSDDLVIPDKNLFSAMEIITLKNQSGESLYKKFIESNGWALDYFPNFLPDYTHLEAEHKTRFKKFVENILSGKFGNWLDDLSFRITLLFLKKKYAHLKQEDFAVNLRTKKHASKHHPQGFQFRVLSAFEEKCREFESLHDIKLL